MLGILEEAGYVRRKLSLPVPVPLSLEKNTSSSTKYLRRQFETNFFGLMDVTNATLPYLRKAKDGCVVVLGSRSAWRPEVPVSDFTLSGHAVLSNLVLQRRLL